MLSAIDLEQKSLRVFKTEVVAEVLGRENTEKRGELRHLEEPSS